MVFHTFFRGRLWKICESGYVIVFQWVMTMIDCYVIRIVFSGKIEQARKTGVGGDMENERTGPLFLQVVDGAMVRDLEMRIFWQNRTGSEQVFLG